MGKWSDIRPSMMSNAEETDGRFNVRRQEWRYAEFNDFMDELDDRAIANQGKPRLRITRYYGTPCKVAPLQTLAIGWHHQLILKFLIY